MATSFSSSSLLQAKTFETHIGPELGAQFGEQIELALSSMPRPPAKRKKEGFFGQECRGRMLRTKPRRHTSARNIHPTLLKRLAY